MPRSVRLTDDVGTPVRFTCPRCGQCADGVGFDYIEQYRVAFIPVSRKVTPMVRCGACGWLFVSMIPIYQYRDVGNYDASVYLRRQVDIVLITLLVAAVLLCVAPVLGLILSAIAAAVARWDGGRWAKRVAYTALALSVLAHLIFGGVMLLSKSTPDVRTGVRHS